MALNQPDLERICRKHRVYLDRISATSSPNIVYVGHNGTLKAIQCVCHETFETNLVKTLMKRKTNVRG
jgi:hypothetical protein